MDISKIKVGSTSYAVKDASARSSISGLGTAAKKDVPSSGNASSTQVVLGSDSRLTDSRPASDVYSWAKQSSKPSYTASEVGLGNVGNFKSVSTIASQGLSDTEKSNARANIGAGTSSFSGSYNDLSNKPSIPSAANNGTYTVKTLVGSTTTNVSDFSANQSSADDVTFVQGSNITITPDTTNRKITISSTDTNTWRPLGTTADTACAGNDSRLSNSRPASDVYSWAKASSKPSYSKSEVGLGNVTNDAQVKRTEMGAASGVATLGTDGKVPSSQLPSYVDDVLEYTNLSSFPSTGESGKIYVAQDTNKTYRWSGSTYKEISPSIVVGTTTGTAFDGKSGYDHVNNTSNPHGVTKAQLGLGNVENKSSATIRGELTKSNVTTALGYTPPTTNTTYSNFVKSGSGAAAGLVPAPSTTAGTTKYLREDGTWATPPDTNTWPTKLSQLSNDTGYITTYTNTVTSINGKTGAIAAADIASVLTAAGYKLTDTDTNTWRPVSDSVSSTDSSTSASSKAVKTAYDLAASKTSNTGTVTSIVGGTGLNGGTISTSGTLSVKYGSSAGTACEGNDSRLSNSRPASDVYSWAKASTKPSYSYSEISGTPSSLPANGGNADTVDNYHIAVVTSMPSSPDANTIYIVK